MNERNVFVCHLHVIITFCRCFCTNIVLVRTFLHIFFCPNDFLEDNTFGMWYEIRSLAFSDTMWNISTCSDTSQYLSEYLFLVSVNLENAYSDILPHRESQGSRHSNHITARCCLFLFQGVLLFSHEMPRNTN